ncbi:hypothetical protein NEDG_01272 [Nematocida displodere]|uniref:Uncharacterized protein n=1 Tax=Nematocida displodere TaxID=1805483 RepID=A0A177EDY0_9MICR|nr:hypothetical protein NEDG_01272 [Nematocida displodere]
MSKQRACAWRRSTERTKTEESVEERKKKELVKKTRHEETRLKKSELLEKRKEYRNRMKAKDAVAAEKLAEDRKARLTQRRNKKEKREKYGKANE